MPELVAKSARRSASDCKWGSKILAAHSVLLVTSASETVVFSLLTIALQQRLLPGKYTHLIASGDLNSPPWQRLVMSHIFCGTRGHLKTTEGKAEVPSLDKPWTRRGLCAHLVSSETP